jgi:hypothetical protein
MVTGENFITFVRVPGQTNYDAVRSLGRHFLAAAANQTHTQGQDRCQCDKKYFFQRFSSFLKFFKNWIVSFHRQTIHIPPLIYDLILIR